MLGATKAFLRRMVDEVISIRTKWIKYITQSEQVAETGAEGSPAETQADKGDNAARGPTVRTASRLNPQSIPKFHDLARPYPAFGWRMEDEVGRGTLQVNLQADKKEVGRAAVQVNLKTHIKAYFQTEREEPEDCPPKTDRQCGCNDGLCHSCSKPGRISWACPTLVGRKGNEGQGGAVATQGRDAEAKDKYVADANPLKDHSCDNKDQSPKHR